LTDSSKTIKGISISGLASISTKGISALSYLWIVTLVDPAQMGAITLGLAFYGIFGIFKDFGLTTAVISNPNITDEFMSSANSLRVVIAGSLLGICVVLSGVLPSVFDIPELREMILLIGVAVFIEALGFLSYALLSRNLEFKKMAEVDITASVVMAGTVVVAGVLEFPMLALFSGLVLSSAAKTGILLLLYPPKIKFATMAFADRKLIFFGAKLVSVGAIVYLWFSMNVFVLGRVDIVALGMYGLAFLWAGAPADISAITINRVMLPTFSALIRDGKAVFAGYMQTLRFLFVGAFGAFAFLLVASPILIRTLYGSIWEPAIPILLILLVFGLGRTLLEPAGSLILSLQRPGVLLWTSVLSLGLMSVFVVPVAGSYGAQGCAALLTTVYLMHMCILWYIVFRILGQDPKAMITAIARPMIVTFVALGISGTILFFTSGTFWTVISVLAVASAYIGLMYVVARDDLVQTIRHVKHAIARG
jgi:O-antigen/teichoic acid export membrane protein